MVCGKCGRENEEGTGVCAFCGGSLAASGEVGRTSRIIRRVGRIALGSGVGLLLAVALAAAISRVRVESARAGCVENVRQITLAALMYC